MLSIPPAGTTQHSSHYAANIISLVLHDQLLAAHQHLSHPQQARPQPPAPQPPHMQPNTPARDQNNIDPAISGAAMLTGPPQTPTQPDITGQETPKTYGKRPLSTSKRAAQNRAAQVRALLRILNRILANLCIAGVPSAEGSPYPGVGGKGEGIREHGRSDQSSAGGKLPTPGVHHQPAVSLIGFSR